MTRKQLDALIAYINAKVAYANAPPAARKDVEIERMSRALAILEASTEPKA